MPSVLICAFNICNPRSKEFKVKISNSNLSWTRNAKRRSSARLRKAKNVIRYCVDLVLLVFDTLQSVYNYLVTRQGNSRFQLLFSSKRSREICPLKFTYLHGKERRVHDDSNHHPFQQRKYCIWNEIMTSFLLETSESRKRPPPNPNWALRRIC